MEYKTITKPDGSEQKLAVYDGKCRFWMEGPLRQPAGHCRKACRGMQSAGQD